MGLDYLKITPEIMTKISAYDQEQQGRIMLAMIAYALEGVEPEFEGMEKFVWPTLKMDIDRCAASVEKQSANGSKGGRPGKSQTKPTETQKNPEKPTETQPKANESLNTKINSNTNTNNKEEVVTRVRARTAAAAEPVDAIDGSDLTETIAAHQEAERLIKRFGLPDNETAIMAIIDDIGNHGLDAVEQALKEASLSDSRGGLSVNFYRTKLPGVRPRSSPCPIEAADTTNPFLKMLREEDCGS